MRELHPTAISSKKEASNNKINKVAQASPGTKPQGKPDTHCYRCGKPGYKPAGCHFKEATCHFCGKMGQFVLQERKVKHNARKKPQPRQVMTKHPDDATDIRRRLPYNYQALLLQLYYQYYWRGYQYKWSLTQEQQFL